MKLKAFTNTLGVAILLLLAVTVITYSYAITFLEKDTITHFVKSVGQPYLIYAVFFSMIPWGLISFLGASGFWFRILYFLVFISGLLLSISIVIAYTKIA